VDRKVARDKVGNALRDAMKQRSEFPNTLFLFGLPAVQEGKDLFSCETFSPSSMPTITEDKNTFCFSSSMDRFVPASLPRCHSLIDKYRQSSLPGEAFSALTPVGRTSYASSTSTTSGMMGMGRGMTGIGMGFGQNVSLGDVVPSGFQQGDHVLYNSSDMMFDLEPRPIEMLVE
jgi:hypothetical protein